jgi:hypothetical protein
LIIRIECVRRIDSGSFSARWARRAMGAPVKICCIVESRYSALYRSPSLHRSTSFAALLSFETIPLRTGSPCPSTR